MYEQGELVVKDSQRPESEWTSIDVPAIISEETWYAANARLEKNKQRNRRGAKYDYLCQGMIRCALCESQGRKAKFCIFVQRRGGKVVRRYYQCNHAYHRREELDCRSKQLPTDWFDDLVRQVLGEILLDEELLIEFLKDERYIRERSLYT